MMLCSKKDEESLFINYHSDSTLISQGCDREGEVSVLATGQEAAHGEPSQALPQVQSINHIMSATSEKNIV